MWRAFCVSENLITSSQKQIDFFVNTPAVCMVLTLRPKFVYPGYYNLAYTPHLSCITFYTIDTKGLWYASYPGNYLRNLTCLCLQNNLHKLCWCYTIVHPWQTHTSCQVCRWFPKLKMLWNILKPLTNRIHLLCQSIAGLLVVNIVGLFLAYFVVIL